LLHLDKLDNRLSKYSTTGSVAELVAEPVEAFEVKNLKEYTKNAKERMSNVKERTRNAK